MYSASAGCPALAPYAMRSSPDTPPGLRFICDGRSPDSRVKARRPFPDLWVQWLDGSLSAHSCGGSHGFGACWLHRTVFPFHPADLRPARTITSHLTRPGKTVNRRSAANFFYRRVITKVARPGPRAKAGGFTPPDPRGVFSLRRRERWCLVLTPRSPLRRRRWRHRRLRCLWRRLARGPGDRRRLCRRGQLRRRAPSRPRRACRSGLG